MLQVGSLYIRTLCNRIDAKEVVNRWRCSMTRAIDEGKSAVNVNNIIKINSQKEKFLRIRSTFIQKVHSIKRFVQTTVCLLFLPAQKLPLLSSKLTSRAPLLWRIAVPPFRPASPVGFVGAEASSLGLNF